MKKVYKYVWSDLSVDTRSKVENAEEALRLIGSGIAILLSRDHPSHESEREAIVEGRLAACNIVDRQASIALRSLRVLTGVEDS